MRHLFKSLVTEFHRLPGWIRKLGPWAFVAVGITLVEALDEFAIAIGVLVFGSVAFAVQISDWKPADKLYVAIKKLIYGFAAGGMLVLLGIIFIKRKGQKSWSNLDAINSLIASADNVFTFVYNNTPWRYVFTAAIACVLTWVVAYAWIRRVKAKTTNGSTAAQESNSLRESQDKWLHEVLESDRKSIGYLVKVFIADWNPEFSKDVLRSYIDFRLAISNISICAVRIEDPITGYITFLKEGAEKRSSFTEPASLAPDQELYFLPRKPSVLIIRQYVDRTEVGEIEASGKSSQFWLHELEVYFYGDDIDRTRLYTRHVITKEKRWTADPGLYCGYDDEQAVAAKIESLTGENTWLKSLLEHTPKPTLSFEIDETQSQVHIDSFHDTGRITAKVRLRCEKTISDTRTVKGFHAALLLEHRIGGSVSAESVAIEREGAQVVMSEPDMAMVKMDNGWKIDEPLTPYRWFLFFLDIPSNLGEPYREHFLRVTMEAVGQEPFSTDFYVQSWRDALQSNSYIKLRT